MYSYHHHRPLGAKTRLFFWGLPGLAGALNMTLALNHDSSLFICEQAFAFGPGRRRRPELRERERESKRIMSPRITFQRGNLFFPFSLVEMMNIVPNVVYKTRVDRKQR